MVKHRCARHTRTVVLSLLCGSALAASPNQSHRPLGHIKSIFITESGKSEHSDDYARALCKRFEPTTAQLRTFIEKAHEVHSRVHTHQRYSPCYASGTVEFDDGTTATWQIHSGRTGVLRMDHGPAMTLQCSRCRWTDPFQGGDGSH
jgi:hypothetical protein